MSRKELESLLENIEKRQDRYRLKARKSDREKRHLDTKYCLGRFDEAGLIISDIRQMLGLHPTGAK